MAGFRDIVGHEHIVGHFQSAIQHGKLSHAYILEGEEGAGKRMLAEAFAMAVQCESGGMDACGICHSCLQAKSGNHPDIKWVTHEKTGSIGVDDVRVQLVSDISIMPYSSPYKIYIIDEAEKMTPAAQNAILKTIEEPPAYGIILFLTTTQEAFLPTILSRCIMLHLRPIGKELIKRYLMEVLKVPDYQADMAVAFAGGNLGKAVQLASSDEFAELKEEVLNLTRKIYEMEAWEVSYLMKKATEYKGNIEDYLNLMLLWYRDVLYYKASQDLNGLIYKDEFTALKKQASLCSYHGLEDIFRAIDKVKSRLKANVNFELAMELLLYTIKDAFRTNERENALR